EYRRSDELHVQLGRRPVGRGRSLLLRCAQSAERRARAAADPLNGGADPPVCGRDPGTGAARKAPGLPQAAGMVSESPPGPCRTGIALAVSGARRAAAAVAASRPSDEETVAAHAGRIRIPVRPR